ncbi:MAG: SpoIIE family protein phosphatase [Leptospiraceae bacterium]|nr:SpoIIE family protein phosphatase [Leptospiraceae bacterium]
MIELKYGTRKVISFRGAKKVVGGLSDQNKIAVLLYISKEFSNVGREEDLFDTLITLCKEIFECDNTTLRLWDGELLVPIKYIKETTPPRRNLTPTEGYSGQAFESKKSLLIPNLKQNPHFLDEGETTKCVICVPITYKDDVLGTISVESDTEFFYKEDDLEILEALGSQLALALTGVRLIEGLMTARAREAAILSQLEWDLKMGRNVQSQILQHHLHPWNGMYFGTHYEPMVEVSGDYFDVVKQGNTMTAIIVDVSGHGIPAALVTMAIHFHFNRYVIQGLGLAEIMEQMGEALKPQLPESTYFTAFILRIYHDYTYAYINGGHQKLLHFKNDNSIEELDTKGVPLGILDVKKTDYEEKHGKIEPGEYLLMFTDGFTEQKNGFGEEYGHSRFQESFTRARDKMQKDKTNVFAKDIVKAILDDWKEFKANQNNGDDLALLLLQCNTTIKDALPLVRMAKVSAHQKNNDDAYSLALQAYKIDPSIKDNLLFLGKMYYNDGKYAESVKFIDEYIRTSGEDTAIIHYLYGKALFNSERLPEAKRALKKSLSCDHTFAKASLLLAKCYLKENAIPKAIKTLQQGIKSTPSNDALKVSLKKLEGINIIRTITDDIPESSI